MGVSILKAGALGDITIENGTNAGALSGSNLTTTGTLIADAFQDDMLTIKDGIMSSAVSLTASSTVSGGTITDGTMTTTVGDNVVITNTSPGAGGGGGYEDVST